MTAVMTGIATTIGMDGTSDPRIAGAPAASWRDRGFQFPRPRVRKAVTLAGTGALYSRRMS